MQYPLTTECIQAIRDAANNLDKLAHLTPVLDSYGEPYRSSGAFAVVFKMKDEATGRLYALKCFTEEQASREEAYRMIAEELENNRKPISLSFGFTIYNPATHFLTADLAITQKICLNFFHKMENIKWKNNLYCLKD